MNVVIDGIKYVPIQSITTYLTAADILEKYEGHKQWDNVVAGIQKWFYNSASYPKTAWCATTVSWCLANLGILKMSMGSRQENVYHMYEQMSSRCINVPISDMKRGDIVFFCWDGVKNFHAGASKHVSVYNGNGQFIGGNQGQAIAKTAYNKEKICYIIRPPYEKSTVMKLSQLPLGI